MSEEIKQFIKERANEIGFDAVGFSLAQTTRQHKEDLRTFHELGLQGTMDWMHLHEARREDPQVLWNEAKSIIVLGMNYAPTDNPLDLLGQTDRGVISCYAQNRDYHDTVKKRLKQLARLLVTEFQCEVKVFVDTAPVLEKPIAAQTSVGWQGKHTCVVSREHGSWLFLGEIYTTLDLIPDKAHPDHCGKCRSCLDICPTDAFIAPHQIDARKCISYLTIEYEGVIEEDLALKMGNRIYGCDDCLAACPWTKFSTPTPHPDFQPRPELKAPKLEELLFIEEEEFKLFFKGSPIKRIKYHRFMRNVLIAVVNGDARHLQNRVFRLTLHEHDLIAKTAQWALEKLKTGTP